MTSTRYYAVGGLVVREILLGTMDSLAFASHYCLTRFTRASLTDLSVERGIMIGG